MSGLGLSLIHPAALWGLAALLIPILIHLFNRSRGRLVRIGHIDLIKNAQKLKVTELKLDQWLLLLLRLALFGLTGLILAGLARPGLQSSQLDTAYVTPAWLNSSEPQQLKELLQQYADARTSRIYILQEGFPPLNEESAAKLRQQGLPLSARNIWPLLTERLSIQQHLGEVDVFATDLLQQFGSLRPQLPKKVVWHLSHPPAQKIVSDGNIKALVAFDASQQADADIVRSALVSLQAHRLPGLSWNMVETSSLGNAWFENDWLFLLSDKQLTAEQLSQIKKPLTVLSDATDNTNNSQVSGQEARAGALRLPFYPFSQFSLSRYGLAEEDLDDILTTADGIPVIQAGRRGNARIVHFNSRFDRNWSSISEQLEFPELLLQLMQEDELQSSFSAARILPGQLLTNEAFNDQQTPVPRRSLQQLLAALMILLWLAERWLSERRRDERL